jgi:hypothetical protein
MYFSKSYHYQISSSKSVHWLPSANKWTCRRQRAHFVNSGRKHILKCSEFSDSFISSFTFLPLFISFFRFSNHYYVMYWKRPHSKCSLGLKLMWDVPCGPRHVFFSSESWDVICFENCLPLQLKRWSFRWVISKLFFFCFMDNLKNSEPCSRQAGW